MIAMGISEFRANMSVILQRVQQGEIVSLRMRDKEIAKLVPPDFARTAAREKLDELRETAVVGDILSPLDISWNAEQ